MKFGLVELVDIDICSNTICSNCISTNYYGDNGGVRWMTLLWAGVSIILAINSIWLLKLNKDLVERNNELIARNIMKSLTEREEKIPLKPLTSKQKELLNKNPDDNKED